MPEKTLRVNPSQRGKRVENPDRSFSSERTITIGMADKYYNIPTLVEGTQLTEDQAVDYFKSGKTEAVGVADTLEEALEMAKTRTGMLGSEDIRATSPADIDFVGNALKNRQLGEGEARKPQEDIDFVGRGLSLRQGSAERSGGYSVSDLVIQEPADPASFSAEFSAGLTSDPQAKIIEYAQARGISPDRYGIEDGEIFYRDDDGKFYYETAQKKTRIAPGIDISPGKLKRAAAGIATHIPEIVLGTLAIPGGPGAVAVASAGGSLIRSGAAKLFTEDPTTPAGIALKAGGAGAIGGVGEIPARIGIGLRQISKGAKGARLARGAGRDRLRMSAVETQRMEALGRKYGIKLFSPQTTGSSELIARFNFLGDIPVTQDMIRKGKMKQLAETDAAIKRYVDTFVSPKTTRLKAGEKVVELAKAQIRKVKGIRSKITKPYYDEVKDVVGVDISSTMGKIDGLLDEAPRGSSEYAAINKVKKMLQREIADPEGKVLLVPEDRLKLLDKVKKSINSKWKKDWQKAPEIETQNELNGILKSMLAETDKISGAYAKARKLHGKASPMVEKFTKGRIGELAKLEGENIAKAAKVLFNAQDLTPEILLRAKRSILRQKGGQEAWDNILGIHMRAKISGIKETVTGGTANIGGWFRQKMWGDPAQREMMKVAMNPKQFETLEEFMEVLDKTSLITGKESATASRLISAQKMQAEATGQIGKFIERSTRVMVTRKRQIGDYINTIRTEKFQENLAEAMMSDRAARQLQKILKLDPKTEVFLKRVSLLLTQIAAGDFGGARRRESFEDRPPKVLLKDRPELTK